MKLATPVLQTLAHKGVQVPSYDPASVEPGILHLGYGNFHRAHMARYVEDLLNTDFEESKTWGIVGAGVRGSSKRDMFASQDFLQTIVERNGDSANAIVMGGLVDYLPADLEKVQETLQNPQIKIVSMTVTEGGYYLNDGKFDVTLPDMQHDVQNPDSPKTVFGLIVKAMRHRKENNVPLLTVMSCDNVPHNGDVVASVVVGLARAQDAELADYIEANACFPNAMVDRIAPASTEEHKQFIQETYGYEDASPVFCEPFRQWVLEDDFVNGDRPAFEQLETVSFVDDVTPYEQMKIRILNGGHATLCYPSALLGVEYVHESMQHPVISKFLDTLERTEIIPGVTPPTPDTSLTGYWETTAERFSNPILKDTIDRNCFDGASRQPKFIVPVVQDNLKAGRSIDGLATVSALWCRYCQGKKEDGSEIAPNDPQWDRLQALALQAKDDPKLWLQELPEVYGSAAQESVFVEAFSAALKSMQENGVEAALQNYVNAQS